MKREQVKVGELYTAKVSGGVVPVRITGEKWTGDKHTGWVAVNTTTNRPVRIKSAQRLRAQVGGSPGAGRGAGVAVDAEEADGTAHGAPSPNGRGKGGKAGVGGRSSKPERKAKAAKEPKPKRVSALDAAAGVLARAKEPMGSKAIIAEMEAKGLWKSPGGKTPEATLYAAMTREIAAKGKEARFRKVERGLFAAGASAKAG